MTAFRSSTPATRTVPVLAAALLALAAPSACGPRAASKAAAPVAPILAPQSPGAEIYELSPLRVQLRRLAPQGMRLLAPHWSSVRESDRRALQLTLASTLAPERMLPFVRSRIDKAAAERPDLAAKALEWLRSPAGYEVKFAEATAWAGHDAPEDSFAQDVADVKAERTPAIRMERIVKLADVTEAVPRTIDRTEHVGLVVARLVNVARPGVTPLGLPALEAVVRRERAVPAVVEAYTPVVRAALLARCRGLGLQELDRFIEFSSSEAGRWYHEVLEDAVVFGVDQAAMDVEGVFDGNAHSDRPLPEATGFNLDSLEVQLGAGRSVRLIAMAQTGPEDDPAVLLRYETSLSLKDAAAVRAEAGLLWDKVRGQVEKEGGGAAVLQATGSVEGWVFPFASSRKFAWRRAPDGNWAPVGAGSSFGRVQREMLWSVPQ